MVRESTLYISLDMPPDLDTKPTEPGLCSLHAAMLSQCACRVPDPEGASLHAGLHLQGTAIFCQLLSSCQHHGLCMLALTCWPDIEQSASVICSTSIYLRYSG